MKQLLGVDIGGTKCAVILASVSSGTKLPEIQKKISFATASLSSPEMIINRIIAEAKELNANFESIGISCGGPLNSKDGIILSPPNLPGWDNIHIVKILSDAFGVPAFLQNDANACALAEWKYGNGVGSDDFVFLTFGTGLGAGIIADGHLIVGKCDTAGEVGHWRLDSFGPVGYGKTGSFEGFASGGGIAQLAKIKLAELTQMGKTHPLLTHPNSITAKDVFLLAGENDSLCLEIIDIVGEYFGRGLALIIDILNPEVIVAGSIFTRNYDLLYPIVRRIVDREALPTAAAHCKILPSRLCENIGDYAALTVALGQ